MRIALISLALLLVPFSFTEAQKTNAEIASDNVYRNQQIQLEQRRLDLQEKQMYLALISQGPMREDKARELGNWILDHLDDYPRRGKARHRDADLMTVVSAIVTASKAGLAQP